MTSAKLKMAARLRPLVPMKQLRLEKEKVEPNKWTANWVSDPDAPPKPPPVATAPPKPPSGAAAPVKPPKEVAAPPPNPPPEAIPENQPLPVDATPANPPPVDAILANPPPMAVFEKPLVELLPANPLPKPPGAAKPLPSCLDCPKPSRTEPRICCPDPICVGCPNPLGACAGTAATTLKPPENAPEFVVWVGEDD
ncbi:classical arabinogalactan protein 9-like [Glycine soja]|uniref:classical arabinogalactan protein 9-like n=1 Tax=Glycine soja TaxID=3848 RepID=UPI00103F688D|nr:classical arabinogalactan protein 9-like [Glycine soja]